MPCHLTVRSTAPGTQKRPKEPPNPSVSRVANASTGGPGRFGSRAPSSKTYDTGDGPAPTRDLSTSFADRAPIPGPPSTVRPQRPEGTKQGPRLSDGGRLMTYDSMAANAGPGRGVDRRRRVVRLRAGPSHPGGRRRQRRRAPAGAG